MADLSSSLGIVLDSWQESVLEAAMGERADGTWAARQVAVCAPRQNGKSEIIVARALAGVLLFDEQTIIVSAHQQDTAREVFGRILDLIESNPSLERRVESVMRAVNREYIRFKSGQSIRFKARSTGSGRGFSCDCLLLDEAQILNASAWSAILPTMSARPNPQAWLLGTPPTENDDGEVFGRLRQRGLEGKEPRIAYLEWSAEADDPIEDPEVWAKANPAFGTRIDHEAVATELASMSPEQFRIERLGIWTDAAGHVPIVTAARWAELQGIGPDNGASPAALGVDMSHARDISIAASWRIDESIHVEQVWAGPRTVDAVEFIVARAKRRMPALIDTMSPAAALAPELKARGVSVRLTTAADMSQACGGFEDRAMAGLLTHDGSQVLTDAVAGGRKRPIRDAGGWGWDRRDPSSQIHPIVAATLAMFGASSRNARRGSTDGRRAIIL